MNYDSQLEYIDNYITFSDEEIELLKSLTRIQKVRKRQFVIEQGEISRFKNYVEE